MQKDNAHLNVIIKGCPSGSPQGVNVCSPSPAQALTWPLFPHTALAAIAPEVFRLLPPTAASYPCLRGRPAQGAETLETLISE